MLWLRTPTAHRPGRRRKSSVMRCERNERSRARGQRSDADVTRQAQQLWLFVIRCRTSAMRTFQITHISVQDFHGLVDERSSLIQQFSSNQILVTACNQMIQSFPARAPRVAAKLRVVEVMKSSISLPRYLLSSRVLLSTADRLVDSAPPWAEPERLAWPQIIATLGIGSSIPNLQKSESPLS